MASSIMPCMLVKGSFHAYNCPSPSSLTLSSKLVVGGTATSSHGRRRLSKFRGDVKKMREFAGMKALDVMVGHASFARIVEECMRNRGGRRNRGGLLCVCELSPESAQLVSSFVGLLVSGVILTVALLWVQNAIEEIAEQ